MNAITPLGDQAALVQLRDEEQALQFAVAARALTADWLVDVVLSYVTVAVFFDLDGVRFGEVSAVLSGLFDHASQSKVQPRQRTIPCCYEFQLDMDRIRELTGLDGDAITQLHTSIDYTVYAIGFCPGFPYLGYLPEPLCGVPRLKTPRVRVPPGSVGLTGRQTGIYTLERPGGWNLIGRTPLQLVDVHDEYFPLQSGDRVRFQRIDEAEFRRLEGQRL